MSSQDAETLLKESSLFDAEWYLARYIDVRDAGIPPERHFLKYGWRLGRNPGPGFSTTAYLARYGDVRRAGVNPLVHYLRNGQKEGREIVSVADAPRPTVPSKLYSSSESAGETSPLALQLEDTQQRLEHYFMRCQELELQLHSQ